MQIIREAVHWGSWYQKSKDLLKKELLENIQKAEISPEGHLKAIVSPFNKNSCWIYLFWTNSSIWIQIHSFSKGQNVR